MRISDVPDDPQRVASPGCAPGDNPRVYRGNTERDCEAAMTFDRAAYAATGIKAGWINPAFYGRLNGRQN